MKTISAEAMAAIEAGEAIVTGAVEIYTPGSEPIDMPAPTDVVLTWQQNSEPPGFIVLPAEATMGFTFFDVDGIEVGTQVAAPMVSVVPGTWTSRSCMGSSVAEAVTLRIWMQAEEIAESGQCFDGITVAIGGNAVTVVNSGAEAGSTAGWQYNPGAINPAYNAVTAATGVTPYSGSYFFMSGSRGFSYQWQDIPILAYEPTDPVTPEAVVRAWGGYGPIELDGIEYLGIGDRGLAQQTGGALGGIAQGLELTLSRLEPELLGLLDAEEIRGGAVILRRLIFASDGKTLLDYDIWERGRVDTVSTVETIGGVAAIKVAVESAARGLGRTGARMRSDSDQRLINPNDGYFRFCAYAGEKMLYWGGKKPSRIPGSTMVGQPGSGGA